MTYNSEQDHEKMASDIMAEHGAPRLLNAGGEPAIVPHEIGWAVNEMRIGRRVRRRGWNGKGMFIALTIPPEPEVAPFVTMFTARGTFQPGWLCSQADLLALDWEIAE